jgi:hypothetical protein
VRVAVAGWTQDGEREPAKARKAERWWWVRGARSPRGRNRPPSPMQVAVAVEQDDGRRRR